MPTIQLDMLGGSNRTRSRVSDSQATINYYLEVDPDGRGGGVLYSTPGITQFADITVGPCRGMSVMANVLYGVFGTGLYSVSSLGASTYLGAIGGTDPVGIDNNGTQLMIVTGTQGYIYTVSGGLSSIADPDFQPSYTCDVVDSYFVIAYAGTDQWAVSAINDGTSWNALDFASATSSFGPIVAIKGFRSEVWVFKEKTTEPWFNAANPVGNPFSRQESGIMQRGCAARYSVATDSQAIYWLGDDLVVYAAQGYQPQRISNHAIEYDIAQLTDPSTARGWTYTDEGHSFYVLSFPDGKTWCFDIATGLWHQRLSHEDTRWRAEWYAYCYGKHLVGDAVEGLIGELSLDVYAEYSNPMRSERVGKVVSTDNRSLFVNRVEIVFESGSGSLTVNPIVYLEVSTDGGRTFSDPIATNTGLTGSYRYRAVWGPLGSGEAFMFKVWTTDPHCRTIVAASMDAEAGAW